MSATISPPGLEIAATGSAQEIRSGARSRLKLVVLALSTGFLLYFCHFPLAYGWLGWIALVPLLALVRVEATARWRYFCGWVAGSAFFWPAISWMTVADTRMIACWVMLAVYCSVYYPLGILLVRRLDRGTRLPLLVTFPLAWIGLEYVRCFALTGFPWYLLAHTQHDLLPLIQVADLGGAYTVSLLVAAVNVVVFEAMIRLVPVRNWLSLPAHTSECCCRSLVLQSVCVAIMVGATLGYGFWRLAHGDRDIGPRIALLQGNLDQRLRIAAHTSPAAQDKVRATYEEMCLQAAKLTPPPELIVWPETSYPFHWLTVAAHVDLTIQPPTFHNNLAIQQDLVLKIGPASKTNVLVGINTEVLDYHNKKHLFNSALLIDSQGKPVLRYDKIHRVPFGEYVPFRDWVPFMNVFAPYDHDYSIGQGDGLTRFTLGKYRFGVLVCYEDTDPFMARDYGIATVDGPAVDFLLNISNDGWFDGSSEHEEHLAVSRFRAIEARRALARAVNMGVSAVIDSSGRVLAPEKIKAPSVGLHEVWEIPSAGADLAVNTWRHYKQTEGILVVNMPIDHRLSFYATYGDWLPNSCWILIGGGLMWGFFRGRRTEPLAA